MLRYYFEWYWLRRFCNDHRIDVAEIDPKLSYWENKAHLVKMSRGVYGNWKDYILPYDIPKRRWRVIRLNTKEQKDQRRSHRRRHKSK